jgi:hypothetical protein
LLQLAAVGRLHPVRLLPAGQQKLFCPLQQTPAQTFVFKQHAPLMQVVVLLGQQMLPQRVKPALHSKPQVQLLQTG